MKTIPVPLEFQLPMNSRRTRSKVQILEAVTPTIVKAVVKRNVAWFLRLYHRYKYISRGRFVEFGRRFRFDQEGKYRIRVGERTIVEENNVWNAQLGDISVGKECWFGLNNIVMGPLEIHSFLSTGPQVMILGPKHPILGMDYTRRLKTVIGNNVKIGSGSILLFGVHVGDDAVITAGSVVSKDVPEGAVFAGNPARDVTGMCKELWKLKKPVKDEQQK